MELYPAESNQPYVTLISFLSDLQVLLHDKKTPKKKQALCKVTHSPSKKGVKHWDVSSSTATRSVAQSTVGADARCHEDARAKQSPEEAAVVQEPDCRQPQEEVAAANGDAGECAMRDLSSEEAEGVSQSRDVDSNVPSGSGDVDQSRTRRELLGAAFASTSLQNEADFKELADEEAITRMKARLKHSTQFLLSPP